MPVPVMALTTQYTGDEAGIALQHPEGWVATSFFGVMLIGESQEALDATASGETPEVVILLLTVPFDDLDVDPAALDSPSDLFDMEGFDSLGGGEALSEDLEMGEIVELEIDGYPAAAAEFTSEAGTDDEMNGYVVTVIVEDLERVALFIGGTVPERWEEMAPTIHAVAHSMTFFEPEVAEIPTGDIDLADEPFINEAMGYSIAYPDGWQSMDMDFMVAFTPDLTTMGSSQAMAVVVMADTVEDFLDGALVGITADQLEAVLAEAATQMGEDFELGEVESLTVDDLPAVGAELTGTADDGTTPMAGYLTLVLGDTHAAMIIAVSPADQWKAFQPTFLVMLDTFTFTGTTAGPTGPTGPVATGEAGESRANPIPLGKTGSAAQWDIQVLEVIRGDDAWDALLAASEWNDPPSDGFEYVLVKIATERTGDNEAKEIGSVDFDITGSEAVLYESPWLTNPDPELGAELLPGGTTEGWLSFTVQEREEDLILVYDEAWEWDDEPLYFALEEGAAVPIPDGLSSDGDATAGTSRAEPAGVGVKIFEQPRELEVLEVIRGDGAYEALLEANSYSDPPREGFEYILLKLYVRNLDTVEEAPTVDGGMCYVTGDNNVLYRYTWVVEPEPEFEARLYPGGEWAGWLAFEIAIGEENLILAYGSIYELGETGRFMALEEGAAVAFPASVEVMGDQEAGQSPDDPAPSGTVIATEQWEFTVLEVLRGDDAWDALYEANEYNDPPEEGMEYVLVRASVRNISDDDEPKRCDYDLLDIVGQNREIYDKPFLTEPEPELDAWLYPNGETEGWVVLQVAEDEGGLVLILSDSYFSSDKRYLSLEE